MLPPADTISVEKVLERKDVRKYIHRHTFAVQK